MSKGFMLNALEAACEEDSKERGMGKKCIQQNIKGSYGPVDGLRTRRLVGTDQLVALYEAAEQPNLLGSPITVPKGDSQVWWPKYLLKSLVRNWLSWKYRMSQATSKWLHCFKMTVWQCRRSKETDTEPCGVERWWPGTCIIFIYIWLGRYMWNNRTRGGGKWGRKARLIL